MKFALNLKKGSTINHPAVGKLEGGIARQITDKEANMIKNIINIHVFDEVELVDNTKQEPVEPKNRMVKKDEIKKVDKDDSKPN
jgi:hypothetical protein